LQSGGSLVHSEKPRICSYPKSDKSITRPSTNLLKTIVILYSHLSLCFPSGLCLLGFSTKTLQAPLVYSIRAGCPTHVIGKIHCSNYA